MSQSLFKQRWNRLLDRTDRPGNRAMTQTKDGSVPKIIAGDGVAELPYRSMASLAISLVSSGHSTVAFVLGPVPPDSPTSRPEGSLSPARFTEPKVAFPEPESHLLVAAKKAFCSEFPRYAETTELDEVRERYYQRLDAGEGHVYLDYAGGGQYPSHLLDAHHQLLSTHVLGNPHSHSPASQSSTRYEREARSAILDFLDADPAEYDVILTANATAALKLVGETYPFALGGRVVFVKDAHNSVNGIGKLAMRAGAELEFLELDDETSVLKEESLMDSLTRPRTGPTGNISPSSPPLIIFTGQSNITGSKSSPSHLALARKLGWLVGLDAAALAPSTPISLRAHPIDFLSLSIYKIVGYPTGVGALVVSKRFLALMMRQTFWGGTITALSMPDLDFRLHQDHAGFEDGTLNYLSLPAIKQGLEFVRPLLPVIGFRTDMLIRYLYSALGEIRFDDVASSRIIEMRGPPPGANRGGTLPLIFYKPGGAPESYRFIVWAAAKRNISVRGGPCLCNYGASSSVLRRPTGTGVVEADAELGLIRVSVGLASNFEDCYKFVAFCREMAVVEVYEGERRQWEAEKAGISLREGDDVGNAGLGGEERWFEALDSPQWARCHRVCSVRHGQTNPGLRVS